MSKFLRGLGADAPEFVKPFICFLGGGTQTSTTVQNADPRVWDYVGTNVNRATDIANSPFQAFNGNPYANVAPVGGTPGYWSGGTNNIIGFDDQGNPQYDNGPAVYNPGTPGTTPSFDVNNFVAPLSQNENMAINAAQNLGSVGQPALNAAIGGAANLSQFQPGMINPATAGTMFADAAGYNPFTAGNAPQTSAARATAQGYNPSLLPNAPQASNTNANGANWNPTLLGNAPQAQSASASAALAGPAATAAFNPVTASLSSGAQINRGDVGNVGANSGVGGINSYLNPYMNDVVNTSLNDIELQRQRAINSGKDSAIAAGAFGGSRQGVAESLTNEAYGRQAAQTAAQLRAAGFDTAAGLSQQDAARAQQGQAANQAADLSVAGNNAQLRQQTGLANMDALNSLGLANSQGLFGASQFNAGAANDTSKFNATNQQGANLFNAGNDQQANLYNTGNVLDFLKTNAGYGNAADQFNASNNIDLSKFNAANANANSQFNTNLGADFMTRNSDMLNSAGMFGANAGNAASLANAGYDQATGQYNADMRSRYDLSNLDALNSAAQFGAANRQATNLANMAAGNQGAQFNAGAINNAQGQNIANQIAGAGVRSGASSLLGNLSGQQQTNAQNSIQGLLGTGALARGVGQQGLDAAYNEFLRQIGYGAQGQSLINASLGLLPNSGTTTSTGPGPDNTGSILGGLGSIGMAVAM